MTKHPENLKEKNQKYFQMINKYTTLIPILFNLSQPSIANAKKSREIITNRDLAEKIQNYPLTTSEGLNFTINGVKTPGTRYVATHFPVTGDYALSNLDEGENPSTAKIIRLEYLDINNDGFGPNDEITTSINLRKRKDLKNRTINSKEYSTHTSFIRDIFEPTYNQDLLERSNNWFSTALSRIPTKDAKSQRTFCYNALVIEEARLKGTGFEQVTPPEDLFYRGEILKTEDIPIKIEK